MSVIDEAKIPYLYEKGVSVQRLAFLAGVSETTVYNRLREAGVKRRPGSGKGKWRKEMRAVFNKRFDDD